MSLSHQNTRYNWPNKIAHQISWAATRLTTKNDIPADRAVLFKLSNDVLPFQYVKIGLCQVKQSIQVVQTVDTN